MKSVATDRDRERTHMRPALSPRKKPRISLSRARLVATTQQIRGEVRRALVG